MTFPTRTAHALLTTEDKLRVPVVILASRSLFGRDEVKVSPVNGMGEKWVIRERVEEL